MSTNVHVVAETDCPAPPDTALPLRRQVADWLFTRILTGEFKPGSRLVLNRIANELDISATPVREAMVILESLGLLTFRHNCGATVKPFGIRQLREMYEVWNVLSLALHRLASRQVDRRLATQLRDDMLALKAEPEDDVWCSKEAELDRRLGEMLGASCDCRRLVEEHDRYQGLVDAIRGVFGHGVEHQRRALDEHIEIVEALLDGESEVVASLAARHNYWCMKSLLEAVRHARPDSEEPLAEAANDNNWE
jgi:DNA-binding GntR family transcriptional regulator